VIGNTFATDPFFVAGLITAVTLLKVFLPIAFHDFLLLHKWLNKCIENFQQGLMQKLMVVIFEKII